MSVCLSLSLIPPLCMPHKADSVFREGEGDTEGTCNGYAHAAVERIYSPQLSPLMDLEAKAARRDRANLEALLHTLSFRATATTVKAVQVWCGMRLSKGFAGWNQSRLGVGARNTIMKTAARPWVH